MPDTDTLPILDRIALAIRHIIDTKCPEFPLFSLYMRYPYIYCSLSCAQQEKPDDRILHITYAGAIHPDPDIRNAMHTTVIDIPAPTEHSHHARLHRHRIVKDIIHHITFSKPDTADAPS